MTPKVVKKWDIWEIEIERARRSLGIPVKNSKKPGRASRPHVVIRTLGPNIWAIPIGRSELTFELENFAIDISDYSQITKLPKDYSRIWPFEIYTYSKDFIGKKFGSMPINLQQPVLNIIKNLLDT